MKKTFIVLSVALIAFSSCRNVSDKEPMPKKEDAEPPACEYFVENTCPYAIMHGGELYYYMSDYLDDVNYTEQDILGTITSTVNESHMPEKDGQANIPIEGKEYIKCDLAKDSILINIEGNWCIFEKHEDEKNSNTEGNAKDAPMYREKPPALKVFAYGEKGITAMCGSYSWIYKDKNGEEIGICADGLHPLQAIEHMPTLALRPVIYSRISPKTVCLDFEADPHSINARAWKTDDFGNIDAQSIPVAIKNVEADYPDGSSSSYSEFEILCGEYVYEITAEWGNMEKDGFEGTAYYSFISYYSEPVIVGEDAIVG